jgi:polyisoprenoid-binding protein YceI
MYLFRFLFLFCLTISNLVYSAPLKIDSAKSSITITFKQMGVPVDAKFTQFSSKINFDKNTPNTSTAQVDIPIASFDLGDKQYNQEVLKKEWFNAAQFPRASFTSNKIKSRNATQLDVDGTLTIKGKTQAVHFVLNTKTIGKQQIFEGTLPIKRLHYRIGEGEWEDTSILANEILIKFQFTTLP